MSTAQNRRPKFSLQKTAMDFTSKILYVVNNTLCDKHGAIRHGQPCWYIHTDGLALRAAVCGQRASKIFTGTVSESSFNRRNGSLSNKHKNESRYPKKEYAR